MKRRLELDYPTSDGFTMRDHLVQVEKQSGKTPKLLAEEGYPQPGTFLWTTFWSLNSSRSPDAGIPFTEIAAYSRLMGITFSHWEVDVLKLMDTEFISFVNDKQRKK